MKRDAVITAWISEAGASVCGLISMFAFSNSPHRFSPALFECQLIVRAASLDAGKIKKCLTRIESVTPEA